MRNLKKILALVLALVMSMSLMATANAFTDDANVDATYDEAVTVLSNLKVFQGYDDGSFQPKGSITRAEVAAIIYRIATGDVTDSQVDIYADYNKFDDVKSTSWYAGYVNYCANAEYIKGYDAKTFGPNDPVTGYQALAMILRAVGYDKNGEFTGSNWQVQTASVGKQLHITDKVSAGTLGTAATREVVAEILFRSILVPQVTYTPALGYQSIGVATNANIWTGWFVDNASIGAETFGLAMTEGEISAVARTADQVTLTTYGTAAVGTGNWIQNDIYDVVDSTVVVGTGADWTKIGYQAYVYTVPTAGAKTRTAVSDLAITGTSLEVNTDRAGISAAQPDTAGVRYYYNGELITEADCLAGSITNVGNIANLLKTRGVKVDVIDNDGQGRYEVVVITKYTVAQVTGIATDTTTTGSNAVAANTYYLSGLAVANSKLVTTDTLAVGDYVTYVEYPNSRDNAKAGDYYVTKAPVATGVLTKIVEKYNPSDATYTLGGADYVKSDISAADLMASLNRYGQGKNYQFYTDPYGYIIVADFVQVNDFLFVYANDETSTTTGLTAAKVVLADGSVASINVKTLNSIPMYNHVWYVDELATRYSGDLYSYTVNADGTYNLTAVEAERIGDPYTNGSVWWGGAGVDTASTVVDVRLMNAATTSNPVYTGYSNIPSMVNVMLYYIPADVDGDIKLGFLVKGEADNTTEIFVYQTNQFTFDYNFGENIGHAYMDVYVNGVKVENCALTSAQYEDIMYYGVGIYTYYGDELIYSSFDEEWGAVTWNNGQVQFNYNGNTYRFAYSEVNLSVLDISKGTAINLGLLNSGYDYYNGQRAIIRLDESGKTASIYFIVGELASNAPVVDPGFTYGPIQYKNGTWYRYAKADNYITEVIGTNVDDMTLSFYGAMDDNDDHKIVVSYAAAAAAKYDKSLDVTGCDILSITSKGVAIQEIPEKPAKSTEDVTYYVVTKDYKSGAEVRWELTVKAVSSEAKLLLKDGTGTEATYADLAMPNRWTIREYVKQFTVSPGATVEWSFMTFGGSKFSFTGFEPANVPAGVTTTEISEVRVTVTAEDDATQNTYTNVATDEEVAIANMIAALEEITSVDATNVADAQKVVDAAKKLGSDDAALAAAIARVEGLIKAYKDQVAETDQAAKEEAREAFEGAVAAAKTALAGTEVEALENAKAALTAALQNENLIATEIEMYSANKLLADIEAKIEELKTPAPVPQPDLYSVKVKGVAAEWNEVGDGSKEKPFQYVAKITNQQNTAGTARLEVEANYVGAPVEIRYTNFAGAVNGQGTGSATDSKTDACSSLTIWYVIVDGVYYTVTPEIVPAVFKVATVDKFDEALADAVDGDTIMMAAGTYSFGSDERKITKDITIQGADGTIFESTCSGVAIYVEGDADVTFDNITFKHASYHYLAGRPGRTGTITVTNCTFAEGYGIFLGTGTGKLVVDNCFFDDRDYAIGGLDAGLTDWNRVTITDTDFTGCNEAIGFKTIGITAQEILDDLLENGNTGVGLAQIIGYPVA